MINIKSSLDSSIYTEEYERIAIEIERMDKEKEGSIREFDD